MKVLLLVVKLIEKGNVNLTGVCFHLFKPRYKSTSMIMSSESSSSTVPLLSRALHRIRATPPRIIASPPTRMSYSYLILPCLMSSIEPRRAAVALIIRIVPAPNYSLPPTPEKPLTLTQFFELDWVNHPNSRPEILYLHRNNTANDVSLCQPKVNNNTTEAHVAFPGGRMESDDEGGLYTAMRQTWEEINIDLAESCYTCIGQLDDREVTTSLGKRLLMILSPFVFLQLTPHSPQSDPVPSTTLHWTPLASLVSLHKPPKWSTVTVDAASRIAPRHPAILRFLVRIFIGTMEFPAIILQPSQPPPTVDPRSSKKHDILEKGIPSHPRVPYDQLKLWGLSLGMTLDLMSYMILPLSVEDRHRQADPAASSPLSKVMHLPYQHVAEDLRMEYVAPSLASVFPRFSYPDVNFWIW